MPKLDDPQKFPADRYIHDGPGIRLMEAEKYREFISRQKREVLANCGRINPEDIDAYRNTGGFKGLEKAVTEMTPESVAALVKESGLRDRTAAALWTGKIWEACRRIQDLPRYVAAARMAGPSEAWTERTLLEGNPFGLVEGLALTGYALGIDKGIIYIPEMYKPLAFRRVGRAIKAAEERRYLGPDIFGTKFTFGLEIREAAVGNTIKSRNPFICGECARSLFDPAARPGFFQDPENWPRLFYINNAETYMTVPLILQRGSGWFSSTDAGNGRGTKIFSLTGNTSHPCLIEAPLGSTPADLLKIAEGDAGSGEELKAFQVGGAAGGIFPASFRDTPLALDPAESGWKAGSGSLVVLDHQVCIVEMVRYSVQQLAAEGCAECDPCIRALQNLRSILNRLVKGYGETGDLESLEGLAGHIRDRALCEFGRSAANPVLTGLRYFRNEFDDHVKKRCPAKSCKNLGQGSDRNLKVAV